MSYAIQTTASAARATEETQDKLLGLPSRGTFAVAPGYVARRVPDIPQSWDGNGRPPLGWSTYRGSSMQHPTEQQFATPLDRESSAALANGRRERLTAQEQTKMATDLQGAVETLPDGWLPDAAQGTKTENPRGGRS